MNPAQQKRTTRGFTMVEMIIVVSILAILAGMSTPPLLTFMQQRDARAEETELAEINKAMKAYLQERRTLPADTVAPTAASGWATLFSQYSNMSANKMAMDTWGNPRAYNMYQSSEYVLGTAMPIFYATVISAGGDRSADPSGTNIAVAAPVNNVRAFQASTNAAWWSQRPDAGAGVQFARVSAFAAVATAGDDKMIKMSDYAEKIAAYNTTLERLRRVGESLDAYSKAAYAAFATGCPGCTAPTPEQKVYFPQSGTGPEGIADNASYTGTQGATDLTTYNGGAVIYNGTTNSTRRTHMINLMRILGLPDEYCCSAIDSIAGSVDARTGKPQEMPFYYFSNPRARQVNGSNAFVCSGRPGSANRKLPARVTTNYVNAGGSATNTDPATCG